MGSPIEHCLLFTMKGQDSTPSDCPGLDFDGEYGRTYRWSIRNSVPGYDSLIEISTAALK